MITQTLSDRPPSGVRRISRAALFDRELRCQGQSLAGFCDWYGVTVVHAASVLEGFSVDERMLVALADKLGVSVEILRADSADRRA